MSLSINKSKKIIMNCKLMKLSEFDHDVIEILSNIYPFSVCEIKNLYLHVNGDSGIVIRTLSYAQTNKTTLLDALLFISTKTKIENALTSINPDKKFNAVTAAKAGITAQQIMIDQFTEIFGAVEKLKSKLNQKK